MFLSNSVFFSLKNAECSERYAKTIFLFFPSTKFVFQNSGIKELFFSLQICRFFFAYVSEDSMKNKLFKKMVRGNITESFILNLFFDKKKVLKYSKTYAKNCQNFWSKIGYFPKYV